MTRLAAVAVLALAVPAAALAAPVTGSVAGPVISVAGSTFTLTSPLVPKGKSTVSVVSSTVITREIQAARTGLKTGACVVANGSRNDKGVVAATRITLSSPVDGQCTGGFRRGARPNAGRPPARTGTTPRRPPGGFPGGNFGFAVGKVAAVDGDTLTVSGSFGTTRVTTKVTVSATTRLQRTIRARASAISAGMCAFVNGASSDKGITVKAQRVSLTRKVNGSCTAGFRRPGTG